MITTKKNPANLKKPNIDNIPNEMKNIPQWVGWKAISKEKGGISKEPYHLSGNYRQGFNHTHTFEEVVESLEAGRVDGLGFAMSKETGYVCFDLDGESLDDIPESLRAIANYSYAERSPSGNGLHIWFKGEWPGEKLTSGKENRYTKAEKEENRFKVECFYETGFLTMTGDVTNDLGIEDNQMMIDFIYNSTERGASKVPTPAVLNQPKTELSDAEVLEKVLRHKANRILFEEGDIKSYKHDNSMADFALCKAFAKVTNDADQIQRLFEQSALSRSEVEKPGYEKYVPRTIANALLTTAVEVEKEFEITVQEVEGSATEKHSSHIEPNYFGGEKGTTFIPKWLGDDILREYPLFYEGNYFYVYKDGVYHRDHGGIIGRIVVEKLGEMFKNDRLKETQSYLKHKRWIGQGKINNRTDIINVKNGLLDWKTGTLHPHTPDYYSTIQLPISFDEKAKAPNIEQFFKDIVDSDTVPTICEWLGYSMVPSTRHEKAMILTGSGANGKSKFLKLYSLFVGDSNISHVDLQSLETNRFKLAQLQGKLANIYADISSQALEKTNVFKTLVSGDKVSAEFKGSNSFDFEPFARLTFSANELPKSADLTDGYFRRLIIVDFPNTFGKNGLKKDPHIMDKISTEKELSGLLNMALEGLQRLEQNGAFSENQNTIDAIREYKREIDPLVTFLEECCHIGEDYSASKQGLYDTYVNWTYRSGVKALGKTKFYKRLNTSVELREYRPSADADRRYKGVGLLVGAKN